MSLAVPHVLSALLYWVPTASAADASTTATTTTPSLGVVFLLIAYLTRRREIGGWLMLYFWGTFSGAVLTIVLVGLSIGGLAPSKWAAVSTSHYIYAVISGLLPVAFIIAQAVVAGMLLSKKDLATVKLLRYVLIGFIISNVIAVGLNYIIYIKPLNESVLNIYSTIIACIWLTYFYVSTRVKSVFIDHTWTYVPPVGYKIMPPAEKKYRTRRGLICGVVFLFGFYTWFTIFPGDTKNPDPGGRFLATAIFGLIVGLVSYFFPILSKARREALRLDAPLTTDSHKSL